MQLLGALFEYQLARTGQQLNILGATSGDTGSAAEYAMRGKRGVRVFMLSPHGRMSPFQQAQMFSLQDPNIHNLAIEGVFDDCQDIVKAVSGDLAFKQRSPHRHRQLDQLGAAAGAGGVLLRRLLPGHARGQPRPSTSPCRRATSATSAPAMWRARWACRSANWWRPPTRTTCSTSSSAAAATACAAAARPSRPRARRWTSARLATSSASSSTWWAATRRAPLRCSVRPSHATAASRSRPRSSRASRPSASFRAAAGTPTGWTRSATPGSASARLIDTHTADGLKVAREHRTRRRADAGAGNGAAGQVRRDDPRGAGHRAAAPGRDGGHREPAQALHRAATRCAGA